ncbi:DUF1553 domain-containing protein [Rapidithrix thailandica]|uniref:DUF1553 domain-containing protein n=1 Tax=Rapidithrix thailandica TaxID=413964 RepID=A0AAW9RVP4_9BACT
MNCQTFKRWPQHHLLLFIYLTLCSCGIEKPDKILEAEAKLPEKIDYSLHIKPILSDRCFVCHGPDKNNLKADLRLDIPENAMAALTSGDGHAIVPGNLRKSQVYHRLITDDPELVMPPPESHLTLTDEEKAYIIKWIEQGATYKKHWALIPPEQPALPQVSLEAWPNNEIDHFVLSKLEKEEISPQQEASKETLIRRVSFDLTGLPPTPQEIDAFLADTSPKAYEKVVDRLLASPHYGEKMTVDWLDLARYADSHGYQDDGMRNMWPWRNWVIEAFNKNMPYDQFVTWQLAGDLMESPSQEQKLATAFNRNHMQSQEGGIVSEEFRVEYVADRTNTLGKAFLGLTLECARCHDHKYDPISQKDYFQLFAFFNNNNETGQIPYTGEASPTILLTDDEADQQIAFLKEQISQHEQKLQAEHYQEDFVKWLGQTKAIQADFEQGRTGYFSFDRLLTNEKGKAVTNNTNGQQPAYLHGLEKDRPHLIEGPTGKALSFVGGGHVDLGKVGNFEHHQPFSISFWVKIEKDSLEEAPLFSRSGGLMNGYRGYDMLLLPDRSLSISLNHTFPDNSIHIVSKEQLPLHQWLHLSMTYDGSAKAQGLRLYINGKAAFTEVLVDNLHASIQHFGKEQKNWYGVSNLQIGRRDSKTLNAVAIDEFMVFQRNLTSPEVRLLSLKPQEDPSGTIVVKPTTPKADAQEFYLWNINSEYSKHFKELSLWRKKLLDYYTGLPQVMVMHERTRSRKSFILDRGAYDAPTQEVQPLTPDKVLTFPDTLTKNRLGLAQWLFLPENPLVARVAVNRYWQLYFGKGIVETSEDFGNQGALPSHPELLDWLAVSFRESGWDIKALQKRIVMSATYRQSSMATPELLERDPANYLLARGPGYRMSAEMIRDNALAASGLLVKKVGGPSVKPYQPKGLWKELATRNVTEYVPDQGENLYRRSMYTIWKRTSPPPSMINFDAAEKNFCAVRRQKTSTPLQALVLLNDPQFVEASRILAEKMMQEGGNSVESRIVYAFRLLTSRKPDMHEKSLLEKLFQEELNVFEKDIQGRRALLQTGEYPRNPQLEEASLAAYTVVANTILNFDEAVFKR